jgi:hypothetical protein
MKLVGVFYSLIRGMMDVDLYDKKCILILEKLLSFIGLKLKLKGDKK